MLDITASSTSSHPDQDSDDFVDPDIEQDEFLTRLPLSGAVAVADARQHVARTLAASTASAAKRRHVAQRQEPGPDALPGSSQDGIAPAAPTREEAPAEAPIEGTAAASAQSAGKQAGPYPIHPVAELFPLMLEAELQRMALDITANGLRQPIVLWHGQVIDGQNRLRACAMAGVEPLYTARDDLAEPDITPFVISINMHRRHLTTAQRESIAAKLVSMRPGHAGSQRSGDAASCGISRAEAAQQMQVSEAGVERARSLAARDPELANAVRTGQTVEGKLLTTSGALKRIKTAKTASASGPSPRGAATDEDAGERLETIAVLTRAVGGLHRAVEQVRLLIEQLHEDEVQAGYTRMIENLGANDVLAPELLLAPLRKCAEQLRRGRDWSGRPRLLRRRGGALGSVGRRIGHGHQ